MASQLEALLQDAARRFEAAGIEQATTDAELLLAHVLGCTRGQLIAKAFVGEEVSQPQASAFENLVARRSRANRFSTSPARLILETSS